MALARGRVPSSDSYYESLRGNGGSSPSHGLEDSSPMSFFGLVSQTKLPLVGRDRVEHVANYSGINRALPALSDPSSSASSGGGFVLAAGNSPPSPESHHHHSILSFKTGSNFSAHLSSSMLSFDQGQLEEYPVFADALSVGQLSHLGFKYGVDSRLPSSANCFDASTGNGSDGGRLGEEDQFGWLYSDAAAVDSLQETQVPPERSSHKRLYVSGDVPTSNKKLCTGNSKKAKPKTTASSKDPQSIAAKNRRERISERLKVLQDLVPNGTKVDLVTMLEKAISYVKFLQLQVKVLATDEFWPTQGGKAPGVSQVKEAIDAILSSQRDQRSSSSN